MSWPIYFKDRLIVSNLKSSNAIASLWTPKELISKMIDENAYCVLGQLYTKKGINYLLRNILANPSITKLYVVGSDLMGSGETLIKFIENGVDEDYKIIGDDITHIEREISLDAINDFRKNVEIFDLRGGENLKKLADNIRNEKVLENKRDDEIKEEGIEEGKIKMWRKPQAFADPPKSEATLFPSEVDLIKIRRPTIAEAYLSVLKHINIFGLESEPVINYVSNTSKSLKEVLNLTVVITEDPSNWNLPSYLPFSSKDLGKYFEGFFAVDNGDEDYTYGERLFNYAHEEIAELKKIYPWLKIDRFQKYFTHTGFDQVEISIIRKLKSFKYDKGAIALFANPFTDIFPQRPSKKTPCLTLIQCQIYEEKLSLTAYFRSNDMYNAWPLNAFALRQLQQNIANKLDVKLGALITISNMAHIYEHNYADSEEIVKNNYQLPRPYGQGMLKRSLSERYKGFCEWDPRGNLNISIDNDEIVVKLMSPRGNEELKEWKINGLKPNSARLLSFQLESDLAISTLGNALYVGRQLERAETAIKLGLKFMQDNALEFSGLPPTSRG